MNQHFALQTALGRVGFPDDIGGATLAVSAKQRAARLSEDNRWVNAQRIESPAVSRDTPVLFSQMHLIHAWYTQANSEIKVPS